MPLDHFELGHRVQDLIDVEYAIQTETTSRALIVEAQDHQAFFDQEHELAKFIKPRKIVYLLEVQVVLCECQVDLAHFGSEELLRKHQIIEVLHILVAILEEKLSILEQQQKRSPRTLSLSLRAEPCEHQLLYEQGLLRIAIELPAIRLILLKQEQVHLLLAIEPTDGRQLLVLQ